MYLADHTKKNLQMMNRMLVFFTKSDSHTFSNPQKEDLKKSLKNSRRILRFNGNLPDPIAREVSGTSKVCMMQMLHNADKKEYQELMEFLNNCGGEDSITFGADEE